MFLLRSSSYGGQAHSRADGIGPPKNLPHRAHHVAACHACYPRPHIIDPVTGTKSLPLD